MYIVKEINSHTTKRTSRKTEIDSNWHPLSSNQHSLWSRYRLSLKQCGSFNPSICARVLNIMDLDQFDQALNELTRKNPMLRVRFSTNDGELCQQVQPFVKVPLEINDVGMLSADALKQRIQKDCIEPFDLNATVNLKAKIYQTAASQSILLLVFNYLVSDAESLWLLTEELGKLLAKKKLSLETDFFPNNGPDYYNFIKQQKERSNCTEAQKKHDFWAKALRNASGKLELPIDPDLSNGKSANRLTYEFQIPSRLLEQLYALAKRYHFAPSTLLLTGYFILLRRYTAQDSITVGVPMSARALGKYRRSIGLFTNPVPITVSFKPDLTAKTLLQKIHRMVRQATFHQDYPLGDLAETLNLAQKENWLHFFQSTFHYKNLRGASDLAKIAAENESGKKGYWGGYKLESYPLPLFNSDPGTDLSLEVTEFKSKIICRVAFNSSRFTPNYIDRLMTHWQTLLKAMVADANSPVDRLNILSPVERKQVLYDWNFLTTEYPKKRNEKTVPLSRPMAKPPIYILDDLGQPVPVGITGELYVSEDGVALTDLNDSKLTDQRFLPNPFVSARKANARIYRTGDLGRWLPDGTLEFVGPKDHQSNIKKYQLEPSKLEINPTPVHGTQGISGAAAKDKRNEKDAAKVIYTISNLSGIAKAAPNTDLPADDSRPEIQNRAVDNVQLKLNSPLLHNLTELCRRNDVTMFITLLASWTMLLFRLSGQEDIVLTVPGPHGPLNEIEPPADLFENAPSLRLKVSGNLTVAQILKQVKQTIHGASNNEDVFFEQLVQPECNLSSPTLLQAMFVLNSAFYDRQEVRNLDRKIILTSQTTTTYNLFLSLDQKKDEVIATLTYPAAHFQKECIQNYLYYFERLLAVLAVNQNLPLNQLNLLGPMVEKNVVALRVVKQGLPFFIVHDLFGENFHGLQFASYVKKSISVYGLVADPNQRPLKTIQAQAARLVKAIKAVQPAGVYRIAGYGAAGMLAYEIATQLIGRNDSVDFLGLLNTCNYTAYGNLDLPQGINENQMLFKYLADSRTELKRIDALKTFSSPTDFPALVEKCKASGLIAKRFDSNQIRQYLLYLQALSAYYPDYLPIKVHLYTAFDQQNNTADPLLDAGNRPDPRQQDASFLKNPFFKFKEKEPDLINSFSGWKTVLPESRIKHIRVKGTHDSMLLPPNGKELGQLISLAIGQANVSDLTTVLDTNDSPIISIQEGGLHQAPLFCIPGAGANVTAFFDLATQLGRAWPVYGLQPRGLFKDTVPYYTVPTAAESYLRALNTIYPYGPLHLLGHSFGGMVAFEMALRLQSMDNRIASLTLIDSPVPNESNDAFQTEYTDLDLLLKLIKLFEQSAQCPLGLKADDLYGKDRDQQLDLLHASLIKVGLMPPRSVKHSLYGVLRTFAANCRTHYKPHKIYPGKLCLILANAAENTRSTGDSEIIEGWRRWAPNLFTYNGLGNHMTILNKPNVKCIAAWLSTANQNKWVA